MNDDVIQVGRGVGLVGPQQDVHQSLEGGRSPVQAEGKNPILPVPTGGGEGGLRLRVIRQGHLPIALREVSVDMYRALPSRSNSSSTRGMGYPSNSETSFKRRKSLQKRRVPSGFGTMTMGLDHGLREGSITPNFNISRTSSSMACRRASGTRRAAAERWFLGRTDLMVKDLGRPGRGENTSENWPTRCCNSFFWAAERWGLTSTTTGVVVARAASWVLVPDPLFQEVYVGRSAPPSVVQAGVPGRWRAPPFPSLYMAPAI